MDAPAAGKPPSRRNLHPPPAPARPDPNPPPSPFPGKNPPDASRLPKSNETLTDTSGCRRSGKRESGKTAGDTQKPTPPGSTGVAPALPSFRARLRQVGLELGLIHGIQEVLGVHGQGVGSRQHLPLEFRAQGSAGILLRQAHLADEVGQVLVEQLLGALDLGGIFLGIQTGIPAGMSPHTPLLPPFPLLPRCGKWTEGWEGSRRRSRSASVGKGRCSAGRKGWDGSGGWIQGWIEVLPGGNSLGG